MLATRQMRILVIEDEPRILAFLARGLEAEGSRSTAPATGRDGSQAGAAAARYDLVVLDLLLPRLDGLSVLRELSRTRPELPVVILSARSDLPTKLRGFELGRQRLPRQAVRARRAARADPRAAARARRSAATGTCVQAGALVLDLARRQARIGELVRRPVRPGVPRSCTTSSSTPGEVVSRERLLSAVWGYHFDPGSNVVDVCIRRLRKKLGAEAPIETVRHAGYRLTAA